MILKNNTQAVKLALEKVRDFAKENLILIHMDSNAKVISTELIGIGISNNVLISPREIYRQALRFNSSCIMLLHNHPAGIAKPSKNDIHSIRIVEEAGKVIGVPLVDSIIFTKDGSVYSFREHGRMKAIKPL